jgi:hypothetical protein
MAKERPIHGLDRSDRPLGQVGEGHRGELVDLAVKGELAPTEDDHHQHLDLVVAVGLDAVAGVEADQVGLQVLPVQPPPRPGMAPPATRLARSTRGQHQPCRHLPIPYRPPEHERAGDSLLGSPPRVRKAFRHSPRLPNTTGQVPINTAGPLLRVLERPRRRCRRRGRAPAPGRGPAVVAAIRPIPHRPPGRLEPGRPAASSRLRVIPQESARLLGFGVRSGPSQILKVHLQADRWHRHH